MSNPVVRRLKATGFLLLGALVAAVVPAAAGTPQPAAPAYPTKTIELIIPAAAGGSTDLIARVLAPRLEKKWGRAISVIPKAAGGGAAAGLEVVQSPPDGHKLLMMSVNNPILSDAVQVDRPYHWDSLTHITRIAVTGLVFVVKGDSKYTSLQQLVDDLKKDPRKFSFGASSTSGPSVFATAQLAEAAGIDPTRIKQVPYKSGTEASVATAGGHIDFVAQNTPEVLELVRGKRLRALAVTTPERDRDLPDVPTTKELGYPGVKQMGQFGIGGPLKLPESIVKRWDDTVSELFRDPQFTGELLKIGAIPAFMGSKDYGPWIASEYKTARAIADKLGLRKSK